MNPFIPKMAIVCECLHEIHVCYLDKVKEQEYGEKNFITFHGSGHSKNGTLGLEGLIWATKAIQYGFQHRTAGLAAAATVERINN